MKCLNKLAVIMSIVLGLSSISFAAKCENDVKFMVETSTGAVHAVNLAEEIGQKHKVRKITSNVSQEVFFLSIIYVVHIVFEGSCKRVRAARMELFELSTE